MSAVEICVDPPTHHLLKGKLFERESNPYAGDDILAPYIAFRDRLVQAGFTVTTADAVPSRPDGKQRLLVSFGVPDRTIPHTLARYRALARRSDVTLGTFVAMECPVVEPRMYEALPEIAKLFRRVLSWSDSQALLPFTHRPVQMERFCWPQSFDAVSDRLWARTDRKFLLMMNANKLPRLYKDELYTSRLKAVEFFHKFGEIDLYGRNWDRAPTRVGKTRTPYALRRLESRLWEWRQRRFPNPTYSAVAQASRGPAKSKSDTMSQYRFALCFENSVLRGWMTEKLFDCFFVGTVPVYWGAPDVLDWVPAETFIDMRKFRTFGDLRAFLHSLSPAEEAKYRDAARAYLASSQFDPFRRQTFAETLGRHVEADARSIQGNG
jgi:hypothetical protein